MIDLFSRAEDDDKLPRSWRVSSAGDALAEAAVRLGAPFSRQFVRSVVDADSDPESALGIVRAAEKIGLTTTAGELQASDLVEALDDGFVVAFPYREGGFGLFEQVGEQGVRVWDRVYGSRTFTWDDFGPLFSELVILLKPSGGAPLRQRWWRLRRMGEGLFERWRPRLELAGTRSSTFTRLTLLGLLVALMVLAVLRQSSPGVPLAMGSLSMLGFLVSYAMLASVYGQSGGVSILCGGSHAGCFDVLRSRYSTIVGIPASGLGLAYFAAQLGVLFTGLDGGIWVVGALSLLTVPESILFISVMILGRRFCRLCLVVHSINAALVTLFLWAVAANVPAPLSIGAAVAAWCLFAGVVLFGVVPHLVTAREHEKSSDELDRLRGSPWALVGQLAVARPIDVVPEAGFLPLNPPGPEHHLLAILTAGCSSCALFVSQIEELLAVASSKVRIWVGFVDTPCPQAIVAAGLATSTKGFLEAFHTVYRHFDRYAKLNDVDSIMERLSTETGIPLEKLRTHAEAAKRLNEAATRLCLTYRASIENQCMAPVLIFDGRMFNHSPRVLLRLLGEHAGLLRILAPEGVGAESAPAPSRDVHVIHHDGQ